jgi:hypothetical protein
MSVNITQSYILNTELIFEDFERLLFQTGKSWGSAVGIVTGYVLDDQRVGVQVPVGARIVTSPYCPDRL